MTDEKKMKDAIGKAGAEGLIKKKEKPATDYGGGYGGYYPYDRGYDRGRDPYSDHDRGVWDQREDLYESRQQESLSEWAERSERKDMPEIPAFLKKDGTAQHRNKNTTPKGGAQGSHTSHGGRKENKTNQPHTYMTLSEPVKVANFEIDHAAIYSQEAFDEVVRTVRLAIADALQDQGIMWTQPTAMDAVEYCESIVMNSLKLKPRMGQAVYHIVTIGEEV